MVRRADTINRFAPRHVPSRAPIETSAADGRRKDDRKEGGWLPEEPHPSTLEQKAKPMSYHSGGARGVR